MWRARPCRRRRPGAVSVAPASWRSSGRGRRRRGPAGGRRRVSGSSTVTRSRPDGAGHRREVVGPVDRGPVIDVVGARDEHGPDAGLDEPPELRGRALDRPAGLDVGVEEVAGDEDEIDPLREGEVRAGDEGCELALPLGRGLVTEVSVPGAQVDVGGMEQLGASSASSLLIRTPLWRGSASEAPPSLPARLTVLSRVIVTGRLARLGGSRGRFRRPVVPSGAFHGCAPTRDSSSAPRVARRRLSANSARDDGPGTSASRRPTRSRRNLVTYADRTLSCVDCGRNSSILPTISSTTRRRASPPIPSAASAAAPAAAPPRDGGELRRARPRRASRLRARRPDSRILRGALLGVRQPGPGAVQAAHGSARLLLGLLPEGPPRVTVPTTHRRSLFTAEEESA